MEYLLYSTLFVCDNTPYLSGVIYDHVYYSMAYETQSLFNTV